MTKKERGTRRDEWICVADEGTSPLHRDSRAALAANFSPTDLHDTSS